jgi:hypothetical protein
MSTARDLLDDLAMIGATVEPAGDRLILRAGLTAIPATLVNRVREAKADLMTSLVPCKDRDLHVEAQEHIVKSTHHQLKHPTVDACIVGWLNEHPASSAPGRCAWCDRPESPSAVVVPFGTEPGTHAWLHAECWPAWHASRKAYAIAALTNIAHDIEPLDGDDSGG